MKILLVAQDPQAGEQLACALQDGDHQVTHCADGDQAVATLRQPGGHYDWVLMERPAMDGRGRENSDAIRAMGSFSRRSQTDRPCGMRCAAHGRGGICGVEWNADGTLQLRCGLFEAVRTGQGTEPPKVIPGQFVFEYQAPCRKNARRNE